MSRPGFHVQMAYAAVALLIVSLVGCRFTAIEVPYAAPIALAVLVTMAAVQVLPTYWHSKGKTNLRDASLTIPWALFFWAILPFPTDIAARLSAHVSLHDAHFVRLDETLGVSVPAIMRWSAHHWIGGAINSDLRDARSFDCVLISTTEFDGKSQTRSRVSDRKSRRVHRGTSRVCSPSGSRALEWLSSCSNTAADSVSVGPL